MQILQGIIPKTKFVRNLYSVLLSCVVFLSSAVGQKHSCGWLGLTERRMADAQHHSSTAKRIAMQGRGFMQGSCCNDSKHFMGSCLLAMCQDWDLAPCLVILVWGVRLECVGVKGWRS